MKKILIFIIIMFSFFTKGNAQYEQLATDFSFKNSAGSPINFSDYKEKVILVVNVASRCGFTNQYKDLQALWTKYGDKEIKNFCETTFGINFPITEKTDVIGKNSHPFFIWAKKNYGAAAIPKWNFHKIIIGKSGKVVDTFASVTNPSSKKFITAIEEELKN